MAAIVERARRAMRVRATGAGSDEGAALALALVLVLVGGVIVGALLSYATGVLRALPATESRTARVEAVKSAIRMATTMQRAVGPSKCFAPSSNFTFNGIAVNVTCTTMQVYETGSGRLGLISTSNQATTSNVEGLGTGFAKEIDGGVFVNAGRLSGQTADILVKNNNIATSSYASTMTPLLRYELGGLIDLVTGLPAALPTGLPNLGDCTAALATDGFGVGATAAGEAVAHTTECVTTPWWDAAGDLASDGTRSYPALPQLPTYERPGSQSKIGSCNVYYPGRYLGSAPLVLNGGNHYFTSGIYYFERPLQISNGANVVMGEGRNPGCTFDADAAFVSTAPRAHEITGKGATLIFGSGGKLSVSGNGTSLRMNRRLSSATTRGSEGTSIRTVSFGISSAAVEVPADVVLRPDGTTIAASAHTVSVSATAPPAKYAASTVAATANVVDVQVGSGSVFDLDGYLFTPNAQVNVSGASTAYTLRMNGGVVATRILLALQNAPVTPTANWLVGVVTEPIQRQVSLQAVANVGGRLVSSVSSLEVNVDRSFAINDWIVDA